MRRSHLVGPCALMLVAVLGSVAAAATFTPVETLSGPFNPVTTSFYSYFQNHYQKDPDAYYLTWGGTLNGYNFNPDGRPTNTFNYMPQSGNPAELKFESNGLSGGGGAGGGGAGGLPMASTFTLGNNLGGAWHMDFSILLFDPGFAGTEVTVELIGSMESSEFASKSVGADDVIGGTMLTWTIDAADGEDVFVRITSYGDTTYAAGFFMNSASFGVAVPEPATMALLAFGAAGLVWRRRK